MGRAIAPSMHVLLIEDNPGDIELCREALEGDELAVDVANDGDEGLRWLRQATEEGDASRPRLVLLDLGLPRKDGGQVLREIKADCRLRRIPVVVLTSSDAQEDVLRAYDLQASGYFRKRPSLDDTMEILGYIREYWVNGATLPSY